MFIDSPLVSESQPQFELIIYDCIQVLFGVNPRNLNTSLLDSLFNAIVDYKKDCTIQDIQNAFRYAEIEKKQYVSLTRDEILLPIKEYFFKKDRVTAEIEAYEKRSDEEKEVERKENEYFEECKQLYLASLRDAKMYLNENHCTALCKLGIFSQHATKELREKFERMAIQEHKDRVNKQKDDEKLIKEIIPTPYRIAGRLFIEHCLNKGLKFIQG